MHPHLAEGEDSGDNDDDGNNGGNDSNGRVVSLFDLDSHLAKQKKKILHNSCFMCFQSPYLFLILLK